MKTLKVIVVVLVIAGISLFSLSACGNKDILGTHYTFKYAQIKTPDGTLIDKEVEQWAHDSQNNNVRVSFKDGSEYYTSSDNVVLYNK